MSALGGGLLLIGGVVVGCGGEKGRDRVIVSGTVTYEGQPVAEGQIRFVPIKGTQAPVSGATIVDGKYSVEAGGGVPKGTHRVEIVAYRPNPKFRQVTESLGPEATELERPPQQQYLPEKYNRRSELEATIEPGERKQTLNFDLKKWFYLNPRGVNHAKATQDLSPLPRWFHARGTS